MSLASVEATLEAAFADGREAEHDDVVTYLEAEACSWQAADRPDLAGVVRQLAADLHQEAHHSEGAWVPKTRPVVT